MKYLTCLILVMLISCSNRGIRPSQLDVANYALTNGQQYVVMMPHHFSRGKAGPLNMGPHTMKQSCHKCHDNSLCFKCHYNGR